MSETKISIVHEGTYDVIRSAVDKMVNLIRPTYGPAGNKVIISKTPYSMVVDDGVQIARDFELENPAENAVIRVIREVAVKTNDRVGDGTTSSLIMLQGIMQEVSRRRFRDGRAIASELKQGFDEAKEKLTKMAKKITSKAELKKVALVSFDDEMIAEMIADTYAKLGEDATITIDRSPTMATTFETTQGLKIANGYISPYMITNPDRMEAVLEKAHILITDYRMTEASDIQPLMEKLAKSGKRDLVVICESMEGAAAATAVLNIVQGKFFTLVVPAPAGDNRKSFLEDVALMTGARMFTESKGDKLEDAEIKDLGRCGKFIARRSESMIIKPRGDKNEIRKSVDALKEAIKSEQDESRKKDLLQRLATFTNSVAVIKVGAPTDNEQKALKYKIEDAVNAVKVAFKHGVVCGAGLSLSRLKTSSPILNAALQYPARQLRENMGVHTIDDLGNDEATNLVTGKTGKFMDVGVMDPVEVLIAGVESAVSIASILVTSSGIIYEEPKQIPREA